MRTDMARMIGGLVFTALLSGGIWGPVQAETARTTMAEGAASVIDGDTIEIHGERIRLSGIDSPESGALCGQVNVYQKSALALSDFIGSRPVACEISGADRYARKIATCTAGGQSLASHMVKSGWSRDWPRYSNGLYADEEKEARGARAGLWGLDCPADLWGGRTYD